MKKFLLLCFLLLVQVLFAQNEMRVVGKGEFQPSELIDKSIRDANGDVCAGLMIVTDLAGLRYDSYNGIVKVNQNPGKDFLFLSPDERVVEIFCSGFASLKIILSDYGIVLRKGEVWKLKVTGDKVSDLIPVTIMVTPNNAKVYIDEELKDVTSTIQVKEGRHKIKIEKEGHYQLIDEFNASASNVYFNYKLKEFDLQIAQINSSPTKARIFLDKLEKGLTNKSIFMYPGKYEIKLIKQGYIDFDTTIVITQDAQNTFYFSMQNDRNFGEIKLNINEKDVKVFINKEEIKDYNLIKLKPALYKIEIQKEGFYDLSDVVEVNAGNSTSLEYQLKPKVGNLQFEVFPEDATAKLVKNNEVVNLWQGLTLIKNLTIGDYQLIVSKQGYQTIKKNITIETDKTFKENIRLLEGKDLLDITNISIPNNMIFVQGGVLRKPANINNDSTNNDEEKVIKSFIIGKYEVTQKEWKEIMGNNPSFFKGDSLPVENISWNDTQDFINKLKIKTLKKFRLPSSEEWEFACRGGNFTKSYKFSGSNELDEVAWNINNSGQKTHNVGMLKPNELGVLDMSGNVWEWCEDDYISDDKKKMKIVRGASFGHGIKAHDIDFRSAQTINTKHNTIGFRLVLEID